MMEDSKRCWHSRQRNGKMHTSDFRRSAAPWILASRIFREPHCGHAPKGT